ncbi:MAG: TetR/AcrR family transcriptional regulator [Pseudomonadales bacterium]|nr:TetR/AcrR family transcriptional regulator [Pseudomonadales bacterium]
MPATSNKRDPVATRQRILDSAARLLAEGEGALEMAWVAKAAGVSAGLAYHHFGSKEGLLVAVVNDFYDRVEAASLMARFDDISDWEAREQERVRLYIDFLLDDPLGVVVLSGLAHAPGVAAVEAQRWDKLVSVGARNIADGQQRRVVGAAQDPELLAAMVLGAARAAVARLLPMKQQIDATQLARDIWQFQRRGLCLEGTS